MNSLNVLSAFDGISCGRVALERAGIPVNKYFAFEIDKWAIKTSMKNFPDNRPLGSVKNWKFYTELPKIDLFFAGFPCQSHSVAGNRKGVNDERGSLLYDMLDMIDFHRPTNFLLENVKGFLSTDKGKVHEYMLKRLEDMGYKVHVNIVNSSLVSAQNRERVYWTTWDFPQPKDKGIILADILEDENSLGVIKNRGKYEVRNEKAMCLDANYWKGADNHGQRTLILAGKAALNGHDILKRVYSPMGLAPTLTANSGGNLEPKVDIDGIEWRKLTPVECERLQTLPDNYTDGCSNSQRYRQLGNGWTVDVIAHILNYM